MLVSNKALFFAYHKYEIGELEIKVTNGDVISGYVAQVFQYGSGLIVLPAILNQLTTEEVGMYYLMLSVGALVNLADFGFSGLIDRNVTYILSGAKKVFKGQIDFADNCVTVDYHLLRVVIDTSRYIFICISIFGFFLLLSIGSLYMSHVTHEFSNVNHALPIWILFTIGTSLNMYYSYYFYLLKGATLLKEQQYAVIISRIGYVFICLFMIHMGFGLISIVTANLCAPFISRYYSYRKFFSDEMKQNIQNERACHDEIVRTLFTIWNTAKKSWSNSIGHYISTNGGMIVAGIYLPLSITAQWGLMTQFFSILQGVAMNLFLSYYPEYCKLRLQNDIKTLVIKSSMSIVSMLIILIMGGVMIICFGDDALNIINSRTKLPSYSIMALYLLFIILLSNAQSFAVLMTARNVIPSPKAVIITSLGQIFLTVVLLHFLDFGMIALLIGPFFCCLLYVFWAWMKDELVNMRIKPFDYYLSGCKELHRLLFNMF